MRSRKKPKWKRLAPREKTIEKNVTIKKRVGQDERHKMAQKSFPELSAHKSSQSSECLSSKRFPFLSLGCLFSLCFPHCGLRLSSPSLCHTFLHPLCSSLSFMQWLVLLLWRCPSHLCFFCPFSWGFLMSLPRSIWFSVSSVGSVGSVCRWDLLITKAETYMQYHACKMYILMMASKSVKSMYLYYLIIIAFV